MHSQPLSIRTIWRTTMPESNTATPAIVKTTGRKDSVLLERVDWKVWHLGFGVGGCTGLATLAGVWSLYVDQGVLPGCIGLIAGALHATAIARFWMKRTYVSVRLAATACALIGSSGIAIVAYVLQSYDSFVPAESSLYSLAIMSLAMGFALPYSTHFNQQSEVRQRD